MLQGKQRIKVKVELTPDKLSDFVGGREAGEFALQDVLHFLLDDYLLGLVKLEVTEGTAPLPRVSLSLRPEKRNFVRILLDNDIVALRPAFEMHLDHSLVNVFFDDLADAPIVYGVFGVDVVGYSEELAVREQVPVANKLESVLICLCHRLVK